MIVASDPHLTGMHPWRGIPIGPLTARDRELLERLRARDIPTTLDALAAGMQSRAGPHVVRKQVRVQRA